MNNHRLIKFRPLANDDDFKYAKDIIENGEFWCSKLWNLNDPMEGVYKISDPPTNFIDDMFRDKDKYVICSFSHPEALECPLLWGYYANGFKGIAIEIDCSVNNKDIRDIKYVKDVGEIDYNQDLINPIEIITKKLDYWKHENEYRYIKSESKKEGLHKIGQITKVYFGTPYNGVTNKKSITDKSKTLRKYNYLKNELKLICKQRNILTEDFKLNMSK